MKGGFMAVPSRAAQIDAVAALIDDSANEERSLKDVATAIVDGIYDMWTVDVNPAPVPLRVGLAFKTPAMASKIYYVGWIGPEVEGGRQVAWFIDASSSYGTLAAYDSGLWRIIIESPDVRKDKSKPRPGSPGQNPDRKVGDVVSLIQRTDTFDILATGDKGALMRSRRTGYLQAESNSNLERYYQREKE